MWHVKDSHVFIIYVVTIIQIYLLDDPVVT